MVARGAVRRYSISDDWDTEFCSASANTGRGRGGSCSVSGFQFFSPCTILPESIESANRLAEVHVRFLCRREIVRLWNSTMNPSRRSHKYGEREQVRETYQLSPQKPLSHPPTSLSSSARPRYASSSHHEDSTSVFIWSLVRCSRRAGIDVIAGARVSACVGRGGCVSPRVARACIGGEWAHERPFLSCVTVVCWVSG